MGSVLGIVKRNFESSLADYFYNHEYSDSSREIVASSFSSEIPSWIELVDPKSFFDYFKVKFDSNDVMLIWDSRREPSNLNDIKKFCTEKEWRCTERLNVKGSEASVTILYDTDLYGGYFVDGSDYDCLTRAKTHLFIVTICGHLRYFL